MIFNLKRIMILASFSIIAIFTSLLAQFLLDDYHSQKSIDQIAQIIHEHKSIIKIDESRNGSLRKIVNIISRFNKEIMEETKLAIASEIYLMTEKYPNLNVDFVCATITHESAKTWDPKITSRVGAMGLMQIMPATGAFLAMEEGISWTSSNEILYNPIFNIRLGCRYLNNLVEAYEQDGGLVAYNGGPRLAEMWLAANRNNEILYQETRDYWPAVLKLYAQFRSEEIL